MKGVSNLSEALQSADTVRGKVSTVGRAAADDRAQELATELARLGVTRVCAPSARCAPATELAL
jgi:hypothetical protein